MAVAGGVVAETYLAEEVEAEEEEDYDPEGDENFAVKDSPSVGEVGYGEEFEGEGEFEESEDHLDGVEPTAGAGHALEP